MQYFADEAKDEGGLPLINLPDKPVTKRRGKKTGQDGTEGKPFSEEKLSRAQDLICEAWEILDRDVRLDMARKSLSMSPYCADAYVLLAMESDFPKEALEFYQKGVRAGRLALGDNMFKKYAGHFWGYIETRPYMRALYGLA
ncbi:hypothetical protein Pmgp_00201 [Pelotomaculum propionicicum]|uniref:Uncharacterized protein n=2 Tax=Pelotomaculum propionicicum TaxID=258475 RepID=A0A4Y7RY71_9FIRM|nr:hypothetical protein Pmgp_00201 [Pelotomaculum propionicicum]